MTPLRLAEIDALADRLIASCEGGSFEDGAMIADMTPDECGVLDEKAFKCCVCDQWWERGSETEADTDEFVCEACGSE